ncbi:hypothetical protein [Microbacterium proteolyticum]|uniref:hypothetical protein n=1 Tax=Microbacterium proteolyticum TaxID=1572644 RepID=UPI001FAD956C|nr:hypothetical protein [Microbacterium proteolyticum]MCI9856771.1 hypothetical protein [Microbacterium proteolyticum]
MNDFPVPQVSSKFAPGYWHQVGAWFRKVGGEHLRALETLPDAIELADWLLEEARRREPRGFYPGTGALAAKSMPEGDLIARADEVADWLLRTHRPRRQFTTEERSRGGKRSTKIEQKRRTNAAFLTLQDELEQTGEVMTWAAQAERLGITARYLRTLRAEYAAHLAEPTFYDLIAEADALTARPAPVTVLAPPSHLLDLLDYEFPESGEFHRHALLRVLDMHPDLMPGPIDWDRLHAEMLASYARIPEIDWGVAA